MTHYIHFEIISQILFVVKSEIFFFRIVSYATTSTEYTVYIIGGRTSTTSITAAIVKYEDGNWAKVGNMAKPRSSFRAITESYHTTGYNSKAAMFVGGWPADGSWLVII